MTISYQTFSSGWWRKRKQSTAGKQNGHPRWSGSPVQPRQTTTKSSTSATSTGLFTLSRSILKQTRTFTVQGNPWAWSRGCCTHCLARRSSLVRLHGYWTHNGGRRVRDLFFNWIAHYRVLGWRPVDVFVNPRVRWIACWTAHSCALGSS
jgi:hypothetical protein